MSEQRKRIVPCEVREVPGMDRALTFVASTERVARDDEIIRVDGWSTEDYESNPVFLWGHDYSQPPIGRTIAIRKVKKPEPRLEIDVEFAGLAEESELGEHVYRLYKHGFLRSVSVGYIPKRRAEITDEERKDLGLPRWGGVVTEADLLEVSAVSVPADPGALMLGAEPGEMREAISAVRSVSSEPDEWDPYEAMLPVDETDADDTETRGMVSEVSISDDVVDRIAEEVTLRVTTSMRELLATAESRQSEAQDIAPPDSLYDGWGGLAEALRKREQTNG